MKTSHERIRFSTTFAVIALLVLTAAVILTARTLHGDNVASASQGYDLDYKKVPATVIPAFAAIVTSFASQHHTFHSFHALRARSTEAFTRLSGFSIAMTLLICLGVGIGGYVSFLKDTKSDVLHNYDFNARKSLLPFMTVIPFCCTVCIALEVGGCVTSLAFSLTTDN
ncbi:hypothetical protein PINS_up002804 [Pythium insidiosum]|nr:hypothetical protein PINS_up002804 [Pythium insidiosum]